VLWGVNVGEKKSVNPGSVLRLLPSEIAGQLLIPKIVKINEIFK
jgi:hypothetical protein